MTSSYPGGEVGDASGALSRLEVAPQLNRQLESSFSTSATAAKSRSESLTNSAQSSFAAANVQASEFRKALTSGSTLERSLGSDDRSTIGATYSQIDNAATALQNKFGFDRSTAESYATEYFVNGTFNTGIAARGGGPGNAAGAGNAGNVAGLNPGGSVGIVVGSGASKRTGTSGQISGSNSLSEAKDFLSSFARSNNWSQQKDAFDKVVQNASNSDIASKAASVSAAYTRANSVSEEARTAYDTSQRLEEAASLRRNESASVSENDSQRFVQFVQRQQAIIAAGGGRPTWNPTRELATTPEQRAEQAYYVTKFIAAENDRIAAGVEPSLVGPTPAGIVRPSANTQVKIRNLAASEAASADSRGLPRNENVPTAAENYEVNRARVGAVSAGATMVEERVDSRQKAFAKVTPTLSPQPQTTLDNVKKANPVTDEDGNFVTRTVSKIANPDQ